MKIAFLPHVTSDKLVRYFTPRHTEAFSHGDLQCLCNSLKEDCNGNNQIRDAVVADGNIIITVKNADGWVSPYFNPHQRLEEHTSDLLDDRLNSSQTTLAA